MISELAFQYKSDIRSTLETSNLKTRRSTYLAIDRSTRSMKVRFLFEFVSLHHYYTTKSTRFLDLSQLNGPSGRVISPKSVLLGSAKIPPITAQCSNFAKFQISFGFPCLCRKHRNSIYCEVFSHLGIPPSGYEDAQKIRRIYEWYPM